MSRSGGYKCYNIKCGSCIGKTLCGEPADAALGCDNRIVTPTTNSVRIRCDRREWDLEEVLRAFMKKWNAKNGFGSQQRRRDHGYLDQRK